ncbi:ABC transporter permease [Clostridium beijerinckii]|uniref:ABC transporter permease n=1 Tax=Clostridium beijerinckii TaxID=1520 RepID=UPI000809D875|nr:ABC transporter permease [Clostridium beijerinckii]OCA97213.1 phosphate transporter permease [Clostridium beijerinckii]
MRLWILIKQDFKNLVTNSTTLTFCFLYPPILVFLFGFLFSNLYGSSRITSYDFYGVTMMFYMILGAVTITPNAFMEERIKQGNLRIAYSPVSRVQIYSSKLISSFIFMGATFTIDMFVMQVCGWVNFGNHNFIYVIGLMLALLAFTVSFGGAVCVILKSEELTNKILSIIATAFAVFSGVFFPIAGLGEWADKISNLSPLKWVLTTIFQLIYDGGSKYYNIVSFTLISFTLVFIIIVHLNYHPEDYI